MEVCMVSYSGFLRARLLIQDLVMGAGLGAASGALFAWLIEKGLVAWDGGAKTALVPLGITIGGIAGVLLGVAGGRAFTAQKAASRIGFEADFRNYGKAALLITSSIGAILGATALYPGHGLSGAIKGCIAGGIGGFIIGIVFTPLFAFTGGKILTGLADLAFDAAEKHASNALFTAEGLQERDALRHYEAGMRLDAQNNISDAIREYARAIELLPDFPQAHHNLAFDLGATGDFEAEIAGYLEAIKLKPDYALAITNLIATYRDHGNLDAALLWK
jgi:tetratricopeptide (TPR) repeat protein